MTVAVRTRVAFTCHQASDGDLQEQTLSVQVPRFAFPENRVGHSSASAKHDRRVIIVNAVPWQVYERCLIYDRRSTPTLVFECDAVIRRVRTFPAGWMELEDEALFALSAGR